MHATPFLPGLSPVATKQLTAARDAGNLSSNGGAVVLREAARRLGIAETIAGPLPDTRNPLQGGVPLRQRWGWIRKAANVAFLWRLCEKVA